MAYGKPGAHPAHVKGSLKAAVALEEFGDFECMPCSQFSPVLKQALAEYGDRVSVTFRHYPLTQHKKAIPAARAAEAAGLQGRFWEMHDALYADRLLWLAAADTREALVSCASKLNLDLDRFKKDMDGDEVSVRMADDRDRVVSLGIDRTPSVFVNGDRISARPITIETLRAAIDSALGQKPK